LSNHPKVSIVVPLYNEVENIDPLLTYTHQVLAGWPHPWELILVDDGSRDATVKQLHTVAARFNTDIKIVELQRNFGQTAAMQAGIDAATGELIVTMDGDMQNDPVDIPAMVAQLLERDLDLLSGWRRKRKDKLLIRKIPSKIANALIRRVTGVHISDYGCSLKVYRAAILKKVRLFGEMHRFIPAWFATVTKPSRIGEMEVKHNPRTLGTSKYGISRVFRVIIDLLTVLFFQRYQTRPGHFFGAFGLTVGLIGFVILTYLAGIKFILGEDIGSRPLLFVGVLCIIASFQFLTTGVLAELLARNYFGSTANTPYTVHAITHFSHSQVDSTGTPSANRTV
jgi:glycosyltransferase involved in cell wall biosynthesis